MLLPAAPFIYFAYPYWLNIIGWILNVASLILPLLFVPWAVWRIESRTVLILAHTSLFLYWTWVFLNCSVMLYGLHFR